MVFDDVEVNAKVNADAAQLRQMIQDLREGKVSVDELKDATESLKQSTMDQARAITSVRRAYRVQNFEAMETLRLVRSTTHMFSTLNQVYQTLILRQINANQTTAEQRRNFNDLRSLLQNLTDNYANLGEENIDVQRQFDAFAGSIDSLTTTQLKNLRSEIVQTIIDLEAAGQPTEKWRSLLEQVNDVLKDSKVKESQKEFEDLFGTFAQAGTAVGVLGSFVLQLRTMTGTLARLLPILIRIAGPLAVVMGLLFGGKEVEKQLAGGGAEDDPKTLEELFEKHPPPSGGLEDFFRRLGDPHNQEININIERAELSSPENITRFAETLADKLDEEKSRRRR